MTETRHQSKHLIKVGMPSQKTAHTQASFLQKPNSNWFKHPKKEIKKLKCSSLSEYNNPEIKPDPGTR